MNTSDQPPIGRVAGMTGVAFFALLWTWFPWNPSNLGTGLDPSFFYVLSDRFAAGAQFGDEVILQYGPYGFLRWDLYHPDTFGALVFGRIVLIAALAVLLGWTTTRFSRRWSDGFLWLMAILLVAPFGSAPYMLLPFLAATVFLLGTIRERWIVAPFMAAVALASLVKFTNFLFCSACIAVVVAAAFVFPPTGEKKVRPTAGLFCGVVYVVSIVVLWVAGGQRLGQLPVFIQTRLVLASDYGVSQVRYGPSWQIVLFAITAAAVWLLCVLAFSRRYGARVWLFGFVAGMYLFLTFKHSFIRHDFGHTLLGGFNGMSLAIVLALLLVGKTGFATSETHLRVAVGSLVAFFLTGYLLLFPARWNRFGVGYFHRPLIHVVKTAPQFFLDPDGLKRRHEQAMAVLRSRFPLPNLNGTVDIYPFNSTILNAHGFDYDPRPTMLSYETTMPWLQETNARHVGWPDGPDHIVFDLEPLDDTFPALEDALSWPHFLTDYQPRFDTGNHLLLDKLESPRSGQWGEVLATEVPWRSEVAIPSVMASGLVWARIEMSTTVLGRLFSTVFKGPIAYLRVTVDGGKERWFRMGPRMAASGFLISPLVTSREEFESLYGEDDIAPTVRSFAVETQFGAGWYYRPKVIVELRGLAIDGFRPGDAEAGNGG